MKVSKNSKMICVKTGTSMADARELMENRRIRHLPVTNDRDEVIGMLSKHDLTDVTKFQDLPIELFATFPAQYVTLDTPISTVALRMIEAKISSLVLVDYSGEAVGIMTTDDLLYELSKLTREKEEHTVADWSGAITNISTASEISRKLADIGI
jgi:acetoin utilization protein AcuB